jgi:hypothetical protein
MRTDVSHKQWVENEYRLWVDALKESTVENFGENLMVKRMLGEVNAFDYYPILGAVNEPTWEKLFQIQTLGGDFKGIIARMIYYGQQVLKSNPSHICEIGGGVGQMYAVLRALGYDGKYFIFDLVEVKEFQRKYLDEVTKRTGLNTDLEYGDFDFCYSAYAYGEFDDETKEWYRREIIKETPHGLIIFNPHSGASKEIGFDCKVEDEYPITSPNNKMLTW